MGKIKLIIIEDKTDIGCAEVYVDAMIEGDEFEFLLDTGAGTSRIRNSEYTLNYPVLRNKTSSGVFSKTSEQVIRIPSLRLGPIVKTNVEFTRVENNAKANLIGMNVLKDDAFFFDFKYNTVDVNPDDSKFSRRCNELYLDEKHHPYIKSSLDKIELSAVWDTGASLSIVDVSFIEDNPSFFQRVGTSVGTDAGGTSMETSMYMISPLMIDGFIFPPHPVAAVDLSHANTGLEKKMDMIIGYRTFAYADWWFDFPAKKWKIVKFRG
jgi:hypothetical protein